MNKATNISATRMPHADNVTTDKVALFPMTESTGSTISDRTGNYADATMTGTSTDVLSTKPLWFNPNNADSKFRVAPGLFPQPTDGCAMLFAWEFWRSADNPAWESIFCPIQEATGNGILMLQVSPGGIPVVTARGIGGSSNDEQQLSGGSFDMTDYNGDADGVRLAIVLHNFSALTCAATLYVNGVYDDSITLDFSTAGGTAYPIPSAAGILISGRDISNFGIGNAGRTSAMRNVLLHYQATYDALAMQRIIADYVRDPGTIPSEFLR